MNKTIKRHGGGKIELNFKNSFSNKNHSFTLAEVLITLVIIGIIAAITVPVVMANHRKSETSARLKKFDSVIRNAIRLAETEWGLPINEWTVDVNSDEYDYAGSGESELFFKKYIRKYIKYSKEYSYNTSLDYPKSCISGSNYCAVLDDGTTISFDGNSMLFYVDINGDKSPNEYDKDQFEYTLPYTDYYDQMKNQYSREELFNNCKSGIGVWDCSYLLQFYDNWEFKDK